MRFLRPILVFINRPAVQAAGGFVLAATSVLELGESVVALGEGVRSEHGTFLFGILIGLKRLAEADDAIRRTSQATSREK